MVTQTPLNFKIDSDLVERLDNIKSLTGLNRNKILNLAVRFVVESCELQLECSKSIHFFDDED